MKIASNESLADFAVGTATLIAALTLQAYEAALARISAIALIVAVVIGFLMRPRKELFYVRTTICLEDLDGNISVEHGRIAIRLELGRLSLLFLPTFGAIAFLAITFAKGTTWNLSLFNLDLFPAEDRTIADVLFLYLAVSRGIPALFVVVLVSISACVSERWVLRDAAACFAESVSRLSPRIVYSFKDQSGDYYGGEATSFNVLRRQSEVSSVVLYRIGKPELSKIELGLLFHRLVVIGRGITDLDEKTVAGLAVTQSQGIA